MKWLALYSWLTEFVLDFLSAFVVFEELEKRGWVNTWLAWLSCFWRFPSVNRLTSVALSIPLFRWEGLPWLEWAARPLTRMVLARGGLLID